MSERDFEAATLTLIAMLEDYSAEFVIGHIGSDNLRKLVNDLKEEIAGCGA